LLSVATSYWPAWLAKSWLILSRTSFSGSTVKFTLMPVSLVKWAAVELLQLDHLRVVDHQYVDGVPPEPTPPAPVQRRRAAG